MNGQYLDVAYLRFSFRKSHEKPSLQFALGNSVGICRPHSKYLSVQYRSIAMHAFNRLHFKRAHIPSRSVLYIADGKTASQQQTECVGLCETVNPKRGYESGDILHNDDVLIY